MVIHLVKVTIQDFKGSLMSLRNLYHVQNSLPLVTNLFYTSLFITLFAHSENSTCKFKCTSFSLIESNAIPYTFLLKTHLTFL